MARTPAALVAASLGPSPCPVSAFECADIVFGSAHSCVE